MLKRLLPWLWALPGLAAAVLFSIGWPVASDQDLYLHLATGRQTLELGHPSLLDRFSYTDPTAREETHSWLSQVLLALLNKVGGESAIRFANFLALAFVLLSVFSYLRRRTGSEAVAALGMALAVWAQSLVQTFRPVVFAQATAAGLVFSCLVPWGEWTRRRGWGAAALAGLWANLHGSCLLAPILVALRTRSWRWTAVTVLALCLNPRGPGLFVDSILIVHVGRALAIGEWVNHGLPAAWIAAAAGAIWLVWRQPSEWTTQASLAFVVLAFSAHRHLAWLFVPIALSLAEFARSQPLKKPAAAAMAAAVLLGSHPWQSRRSVPPIPHTVEFLDGAGLTGDCFNYPSWGSYLVYRLHPRIRVAHTMRLLTHAKALLWEREKWKEKGGITLKEVTARWPSTAIALLPSRWPIPYLYDAKEWGLAYVNDEAAVLIRRNPENEANWAAAEAYYRGKGVPFDRAYGFRLKEAVEARPDWVRAQQEPGGWGRWPDAALKGEADRLKVETFGRWTTWSGATILSAPQRFYWKESNVTGSKAAD